MADKRLAAIDERLLMDVITVLRCGEPMTTAQIAKAATKRWSIKISPRQVDGLLKPLAGSLVSVAGVPQMRVHRERRRGLFPRPMRWRLVEAPGLPPQASGAAVPARPYSPRLSGAAAAELSFRQDDPPTNAVGQVF
jgi:hypothetical protein